MIILIFLFLSGIVALLPLHLFLLFLLPLDQLPIGKLDKDFVILFCQYPPMLGERWIDRGILEVLLRAGSELLEKRR